MADRKCVLDGYFTLEAAVITAISMFIICTAILLSFNIHDRVVMRADSEAAIIENIPGRNKDEKKAAAGIMREAAENMILTDEIAASVESLRVDEKDGAFSIAVTGQFDWMLAPVVDYVNESLSTPSSSVKISNLNGRQILLRYKLAKDLLSDKQKSAK